MCYCQGQREAAQLHPVPCIPPHLTQSSQSPGHVSGSKGRGRCHCLSRGPCSPSPHQRLCQITADHRKPPTPTPTPGQGSGSSRILPPPLCSLGRAWASWTASPPTTRVPAGDGPFCLGWWALARAGSSQVNQHHPFAAQTPDPRAQLSQCHLKLTIWARGGCRGRSWGCHENPHAGISSFGEAEPYFAGGVGF